MTLADDLVPCRFHPLSAMGDLPEFVALNRRHWTPALDKIRELLDALEVHAKDYDSDNTKVAVLEERTHAEMLARIAHWMNKQLDRVCLVLPAP